MFSHPLLSFHNAWGNYFPDQLENEMVSNKSTLLKPTPPNYQILLCSFLSLSSGAVTYSSSSNPINLYISTSNFYGCNKTGSSGGAILVNSGSVVVEKVCGVASKIIITTNAGIYGQFANIKVTDGQSNKNYVIQSSICICGNAAATGNPTSMLYHSGGDQKIANVNFTENKGLQGPTFSSIKPNNAEMDNSYNTFKNNTAHNSYLISYNTGTYNLSMKRCNFIANTLVVYNNMGAFITLSGDVNMSLFYCSFINNTNFVYVVSSTSCVFNLDQNYMDNNYLLRGKSWSFGFNKTIAYTNRFIHLDLASCGHEFGNEYFDQKECKVQNLVCEKSFKILSLISQMLAQAK